MSLHAATNNQKWRRLVVELRRPKEKCNKPTAKDEGERLVSCFFGKERWTMAWDSNYDGEKDIQGRSMQEAAKLWWAIRPREKKRGEGCNSTRKTADRGGMLVEGGQVFTEEEGGGRSTVEMKAKGWFREERNEKEKRGEREERERRKKENEVFGWKFSNL